MGWTMTISRKKLVTRLTVLAAATISLSGCYYDAGLGYYDSGYNAYDCDPYSQFDSYYDCDYGYGFNNIGYGGGWYDSFWYPGYGMYLFDNYGRRFQMADHHRRYWGGRRHEWYREHRGRSGNNNGQHGYTQSGGGRDTIGWPEQGGGRVRDGDGRRRGNEGRGRDRRNENGNGYANGGQSQPDGRGRGRGWTQPNQPAPQAVGTQAAPAVAQPSGRGRDGEGRRGDGRRGEGRGGDQPRWRGAPQDSGNATPNPQPAPQAQPRSGGRGSYSAPPSTPRQPSERPARAPRGERDSNVRPD
jgi:hypothetical protein